MSIGSPRAPLGTDAAEEIVGGMSGSPIKDDDGSVISLVSIGSLTHTYEGAPNPILSSNLPAWLRDELFVRESGMDASA